LARKPPAFAGDSRKILRAVDFSTAAEIVAAAAVTRAPLRFVSFFD
jgi:hypothetical protein